MTSFVAKMSVRVVLIGFVLNFQILLAQETTADFALPQNGCLSQSIKLTNTSTNGLHYQWDFCQGDLARLPQAQNLGGLAGGGSQGIEVIFDGQQWFAFIVTKDENSIIRLAFGSSLDNPAPIRTNLGNLNGGIVKPIDIEVLYVSGAWYGFVYGEGTSVITRVDFGTGLTTSAAELTTQTIVTGVAESSQSGLDVIAYDQKWFIVYSRPFSLNVVRLQTINSIPDVDDILTTGNVGELSVLGDVKVIQHEGDWFAYAVTVGNARVYKFSFGSNVFSVPNYQNITGVWMGSAVPIGLDIGIDNNEYYCYVSTNAGLIRVLLGSNPAASDNPSGTNLGSFGVLAQINKIDLVKHNGIWRAFTCGTFSNNLYRFSFPDDECGNPISTEMEPTARYTSSGAKGISLRAYSDPINFVEVSRVITISTLSAPIINFASTNNCTESPIEFLHQSSLPLQTINWSFGDMQVSTNANPSHLYTVAGDYTVRLNVQAANGCNNFIEHSTKIYDPPTPSFDSPFGLICTNNEVLISNNTLDIFDGILTYQWYIDNTLVSETRDLSHTFVDVGSYTIKLVTSIPGCSAEAIEMTSPVQAGPVIDFTSTGVCEQEPIQFTSQISDVVISRTWNFADGSSSAEVDPSHVFSTYGTYNVSLTALSPNGCENRKVKLITINEKPQPDFLIESPPSSCSGALSRFTDLTTGVTIAQLESWHWNFDDGATSSEQNPTHIFQTAGQYDVGLTVTTEHGCSDVVVLPITILQSPSLNFNSSTACVNKPISFNATSDSAINYYWEIGTSFYETQTTNHTFTTAGPHVIKLNAIGSNGCVTELSRSVTVPVPFVPVFTFENNCVDRETRFTTQPQPADPVVSYQWSFAGEGTSTNANPTFQFTSLGNKTVGLQVTASSGCVYQSSATVNVIEPPHADFSFTPSFGVPPQEISFTNTSTNATTFNWDFGDGASSIEKSPNHTFSEFGDYSVKLTSSNTAGCESIIQKSISMVAPLPDVDLNLMTITPNNDGTLKVIITIENKGNTFLRDLPVKLDVSGAVTLETIVDETIAPFSFYNLVMDFAIAKTSNLEFLCASATLNGDLHPEGNRICEQLNSRLAIITPHPNPVSDFLLLEWIAVGSENVQVDLIDLYGKTVLATSVSANPGLNRSHIDVRGLRSGKYILRIISQTRSETHPVLVSH